MKELKKNGRFNYYGTVTDNIVCNKLIKMYKNDQVFILDISSNKDGRCVSIPFATIIPLHDLPQSLERLPKDKVIAVYSSDPEVEEEAYNYLLSEGFDVKIVLENFYSSFEFKPSVIDHIH